MNPQAHAHAQGGVDGTVMSGQYHQYHIQSAQPQYQTGQQHYHQSGSVELFDQQAVPAARANHYGTTYPQPQDLSRLAGQQRGGMAGNWAGQVHPQQGEWTFNSNAYPNQPPQAFYPQAPPTGPLQHHLQFSSDSVAVVRTNTYGVGATHAYPSAYLSGQGRYEQDWDDPDWVPEVRTDKLQTTIRMCICNVGMLLNLTSLANILWNTEFSSETKQKFIQISRNGMNLKIWEKGELHLLGQINTLEQGAQVLRSYARAIQRAPHFDEAGDVHYPYEDVRFLDFRVRNVRYEWSGSSRLGLNLGELHRQLVEESKKADNEDNFEEVTYNPDVKLKFVKIKLKKPSMDLQIFSNCTIVVTSLDWKERDVVAEILKIFMPLFMACRNSVIMRKRPRLV